MNSKITLLESGSDPIYYIVPAHPSRGLTGSPGNQSHWNPPVIPSAAHEPEPEGYELTPRLVELIIICGGGVGANCPTNIYMCDFTRNSLISMSQSHHRHRYMQLTLSFPTSNMDDPGLVVSMLG